HARRHRRSMRLSETPDAATCASEDAPSLPKRRRRAPISAKRVRTPRIRASNAHTGGPHVRTHCHAHARSPSRRLHAARAARRAAPPAPPPAAEAAAPAPTNPDTAALSAAPAPGAWAFLGDDAAISAGFGQSESERQLVIVCNSATGALAVDAAHALAPDQD